EIRRSLPSVRTWRSTKGSIMPCSCAMRRIHLSDLMLMAGVLRSWIKRENSAHLNGLAPPVNPPAPAASANKAKFPWLNARKGATVAACLHCVTVNRYLLAASDDSFCSLHSVHVRAVPEMEYPSSQGDTSCPIVKLA